MSAPRTRRAATVAAGSLVAVLLPALAATAPAHADPACTSETPQLLLSCDDERPPETAITRTTPAPNAAGWVAQDSVEVTFEGRHTDADPDPIAFECQWTGPGAASTTWERCTSPVRRTGLQQATYTLRVRAVDSADAVLVGSDTPLGGEVVPDHDATPAGLTFRVDTVRPDSVVFGLPYDELRPDLPMVTSPEPVVRLSGSGDAVGYRCTVDGAVAPCSAGSTRLTGLRPGDHTLQVQAVDRAGNTDATPASVRFAVPRDLRKARGWKVRRGSAYFGGHVLESRTQGATLEVPARRYREVRIIAPTGPRLGRLEVRFGGGRWQPVQLASKRDQRFSVIQVRDEFQPVAKGPIRLRVASTGRPVRVDAVLAH